MGGLAAGMGPSYWSSFVQNLASEPGWQVAWGQYVDVYSEEFFKLDLQATQVEQGGARQGIDQGVKVASQRVLTPRNRSKHPWVRGSAASSGGADGLPVCLQSDGWANGQHAPSLVACRPRRHGAIGPSLCHSCYFTTSASRRARSSGNNVPLACRSRRWPSSTL